MATTRGDLYGQFGPKLVEAVVTLMLEEINTLRTQASLPTYTPQQMMDALDTKLAGLDPLPWE